LKHKEHQILVEKCNLDKEKGKAMTNTFIK